MSSEAEYHIPSATTPRDDWRKDVWALSMPAGKKLLLLALADHATDSGEFEVSITDLSQDTGLHERTVRRMLIKFTEAGLVRRRNARGAHNCYRYILQRRA